MKRLRFWWLRIKATVFDPYPAHDISILPGGHVLHHSGCWCRRSEHDAAGFVDWARLSIAEERLQLARRALIQTGYFTAEQVGDDIAPRITELYSAITPCMDCAPGQPGTCALAPAGWYCSLVAGHDGPCPTWPVAEPPADTSWVTFDDASRSVPPDLLTPDPGITGLTARNP